MAFHTGKNFLRVRLSPKSHVEILKGADPESLGVSQSLSLGHWHAQGGGPLLQAGLRASSPIVNKPGTPQRLPLPLLSAVKFLYDSVKDKQNT